MGNAMRRAIHRLVVSQAEANSTPVPLPTKVKRVGRNEKKQKKTSVL
jgi:hypothetical protein